MHVPSSNNTCKQGSHIGLVGPGTHRSQEFLKMSGAPIQTPNSRPIVIRTPPKRDPKFTERAIWISRDFLSPLVRLNPKTWGEAEKSGSHPTTVDSKKVRLWAWDDLSGFPSFYSFVFGIRKRS